ncbi:MAG: acyl-CoA dehydrogenase family protein [Solirubrobacterales bacterium]|jgi:alkylation response protein AidB-like acyl-CoA dehydrogenase
MGATLTAEKTQVISREALERFWERAPLHDREASFFEQDFQELKQAGYLRLAVPEELGGLGRNLAEVAREQRRLAYYSAPTALAINMHVYWTGLAADLWRSGDRSLEWLLRGAVNGEVYAAGHAETGNDLPVLLSTTKAERKDGGYAFTGRKSFGSLAPVWSYLGVHGMDTSDPAHPKVVHAFLHRDAKNYKVQETWDVLGMRSTRSEDTVLDGAFVPDARIARVVPAGPAGFDAFILGIFAWALLGFGNVYYGLARRVFDLTVERVKSKTSLGLSRSMAYHAEIQHAIAEMALELEAIEPHLDRVAEDWSAGVNHGAAWPSKIVAVKYRAVEGSWRVVDQALDVAGGFGIFRKGGLERLFRDARLGRIHPANAFLTHEIVAKTALGIGLDETPRWG